MQPEHPNSVHFGPDSDRHYMVILNRANSDTMIDMQWLMRIKASTKGFAIPEVVRL
jgi:hypothetical protein